MIRVFSAIFALLVAIGTTWYLATLVSHAVGVFA